MNNENESMTYKNMLHQVEAIVTTMAKDDLELDDMVSKVEQGYSLIKAMRERLSQTREKIDLLRIEAEERSNTD